MCIYKIIYIYITLLYNIISHDCTDSMHIQHTDESRLLPGMHIHGQETHFLYTGEINTQNIEQPNLTNHPLA